MIGWDRGRPARNAPQARSLCRIRLEIQFAPAALICGRDARGPSQSLDAVGISFNATPYFRGKAS